MNIIIRLSLKQFMDLWDSGRFEQDGIVLHCKFKSQNDASARVGFVLGDLTNGFPIAHFLLDIYNSLEEIVKISSYQGFVTLTKEGINQLATYPDLTCDITLTPPFVDLNTGQQLVMHTRRLKETMS